MRTHVLIVAIFGTSAALAAPSVRAVQKPADAGQAFSFLRLAGADPDQLWVLNTEAGVWTLRRDGGFTFIKPNPLPSNDIAVVDPNDRVLYYAADDGTLYRTDGRNAQSERFDVNAAADQLKAIQPSAADGVFANVNTDAGIVVRRYAVNDAPRELLATRLTTTPLMTDRRGRILFAGAPDGGHAVFTSDGTIAGTVALHSQPYTALGTFVPLRGGAVLCRFDGMAHVGNGRAVAIQNGEQCFNIVGGRSRVFFQKTIGAPMIDTWVYEGTGPARIAWTRAVPNGTRTLAWDDRLVIYETAGTPQLLLGDEAATALTPVAGVTLTTQIPMFPVPGGDLLFVAESSSTGRELWRIARGGTQAELVADLNPGPANSAPHGFTLWGDDVAFLSLDTLYVMSGEPRTPEPDDLVPASAAGGGSGTGGAGGGSSGGGVGGGGGTTDTPAPTDGCSCHSTTALLTLGLIILTLARRPRLLRSTKRSWHDEH